MPKLIERIEGRGSVRRGSDKKPAALGFHQGQRLPRSQRNALQQLKRGRGRGVKRILPSSQLASPSFRIIFTTTFIPLLFQFRLVGDQGLINGKELVGSIPYSLPLIAAG